VRWFALALVLGGCEQIFPLEFDGAFETNVAFVTSSTHPGNFGGLTAADEICATRAAEAELPGSYVAWLSDDTTNANDRIKDARGWVRVDGQAIADRFTDLTTFGPVVPIALTESGADVRGNGAVWTGSNADGSKASQLTCASWTAGEGVAATVGDQAGVAGTFAATIERVCTESQRIYCFGVDKLVELVVPAEDGPIAFVSSQRWDPASSIATADALCNTDAGDADLSGSFLAALAPAAGQTAAGRFATSADYVRVDGVRLGRILTATPNTGLVLTATGQVATELTWTGGLPGNAPQNVDANCGDWLRTDVNGIVGAPHSTTRLWIDSGSVQCTNQHPIYCLQN
jgi:hypothetical protein